MNFFSMCVHYSDKHHGVKSVSISFYNYNSKEIGNTSKVQIAIEYSILQFFQNLNWSRH